MIFQKKATRRNILLAPVENADASSFNLIKNQNQTFAIYMNFHYR